MLIERNLQLKKRLREGEVTVGAWLSFACPAVAEIMAGASFDWLLIDTEHAPFTLENLESVLMAFNGRDTVPIVRVPWNDRVIIKQVLDLGAGGVLVPHVCSPEEAREAVAACKYPPEGIRGYGPRRASDYYRNAASYVRDANKGVIVAIQIENIEAVKAAKQILTVPGVDVVLLGPMDLAASLGVLGEPGHPRVVEAIGQVIAEARQLGIPVGVPMDESPEVILDWASRGCNFVIVGEDHGFLRRSIIQTLSEFRSRLTTNGNP